MWPALRRHELRLRAVVCCVWFLQLVQTEARYLPQAIKDKYRTCEVHTFMGLFPEVHRAFVVFDNTLMLWNYDHNDVDTTFDELDQVIVSVALVVPRPDAFNDFVKVRLAPLSRVDSSQLIRPAVCASLSPSSRSSSWLSRRPCKSSCWR